MKIHRGAIFYVKNNDPVEGSEMAGDRPAIIVSNDKNNDHSTVVEVVYLTRKRKGHLPTHVRVKCKHRGPSTAICEQVSSVSVERLEQYVRTCTEAEMKAIDRALTVSLGLKSESPQKPVMGTVKGFFNRLFG